MDILCAEKKDGKLMINYSVKDEAGKVMKNVILDARINMADDKDEVPQEGKSSVGNEKNTVTFQK